MSKFDLIIRNGMVVTDKLVEKLDIAVVDGSIVEIAPEISGTSKEEIDAKGKYILPGGYDCHVHFNEPGRTNWESLLTGTSSLAAGGMTSFTDMPLNSTPVTTNGKNFDLKLEAAKKNSLVDYSFWGGLTPDNLEKLEELAERGVVGFKAFTCFSGLEEFEGADDWTLYRGMEIAAKLGLPVSVHAENRDITNKLTEKFIKEGKTSPRDFLNSRPEISEVEAVQRIILFAEETKCKLHIAHISTAKAVKLVVEARRKGIDVSCETVSQYLTFTEDDLEGLGPIGKCCPPLRAKDTKEKLWEHVAAGDVDAVCSDHSPAPFELKKDSNFFKVWGGISGCQSTMNVMLTEGYHNRGLSLVDISRLLSLNPAKRFGIKNKGAIKEGYDADMVLVDLNESFTLKADDLFYMHKVSPLVGLEFKGKIVRTILRGKTIFQDGKIISEPIGKFLRP
ncbi:allantoinase AllB [Tissierella sp.]|uniref:allantoinase AllB n=1 Tax=Tissierella sp. TaxID=41274 RepID=UPI0028AE54FA|nr:allantoinase AllB [Tissierella sp.]